MDVYQELSVPRIVNADARWTGLGGSRMDPQTLEAMRDAASSYVDINLLQRMVGERLAELTGNEAAYVGVNATASIVLSVAAAITRGEERAIWRLPEAPNGRNEVLVHSGHRIPFDAAIEVAGGRIVQFGNAYHTDPGEMRAAITSQTAAVFYVAGDHVHGALSLPQTVEIAHANNIPVIVDAAAQLPPASNLSRFSRDQGADLVIFSGGKDIRGPQASGLIVGSSEMIEACRRVGPPSPYWPRALKTGKEEIVGLWKAVELYVQRDENEYLQGLEECVSQWSGRLSSIAGVTTCRLVPSLDGQPTPRLKISIDSALTRVSAADLAQRLTEGDHPIRVGSGGSDWIYLNPETLTSDEQHTVIERVASVLTSGDGAGSHGSH